jgi:predicted nucleic acid-binding protein
VRLVDTSAWGEYLRDTGSATARAVSALVDDDLASIAICPPVAMELLAGARDDAALLRLERLVAGLPMLGIEPEEDVHAAAALFRAARRHGGVRSLVDCLIAAIAIRHAVTVVHHDADFDAIAAVARLRVHSSQ